MALNSTDDTVNNQLNAEKTINLLESKLNNEKKSKEKACEELKLIIQAMEERAISAESLCQALEMKFKSVEEEKDQLLQQINLSNQEEKEAAAEELRSISQDNVSLTDRITKLQMELESMKEQYRAVINEKMV